MPAYVFLLINHLGEPFDSQELDLEDDQKALDHAQGLAGRNYPVEVRSGDRLVGKVPLQEWRAEAWLKPYLGPWPLS